MARLRELSLFLRLFVYFSVILCCFSSLVIVKANRQLDEDNWRDILEGEWMVEFYAPWCPACTALQGAWKELSNRLQGSDLRVRTGAVDVTSAPGLSGRFVVTALPTIFHVKEGQFRQYKGARDVESMLAYVRKRLWQQTEPVPGWKAPDSLQMTLVAEFFKLSQLLRSVHTMLMEQYGLPTWGSYLIFALATIFIGALLGLILVCFIDMAYPPKRGDRAPRDKGAAGQAGGGQGVGVGVGEDAGGDQRARGGSDRSDEDELINDDIIDDAADSDSEKNSPSDTSEEETKDKSGDAVAAGAREGREGREGREVTGAAGGEVRKRRPRKAD